MKQTTFKCEITDEALDAYDEHVKQNPNGMPLYNGRSRNKVYYSYVIHETKTSVVVEELK